MSGRRSAASLSSQLPICAIPAEHLFKLGDVFGEQIVKENALLPIHRPFVWHNISVFVAHRTHSFAAKEGENRIECLALVRFEVLEFHDLQLLTRKKFEHALQLASIKSSLKIGKTARFSRRRAGNACFFFSNRVEKIQRLAASVSLHI